jgi:hypothetical protein
MNHQQTLAAKLTAARTGAIISVAVSAAALLVSCSSTDTPPQAPSAPATTAVAASGWTSELIGESARAVEGISLLAFGPAGQAVALNNFDTSCCSSQTLGWARGTDGEWTAIQDTERTFVTSSPNGGLGGPVDVAWLNDRFIAIGTRGVEVVEDPKPGTATTWSSTDGLAWTLFEEVGNLAPLSMTTSTDGKSLISLWSGQGELVARSTTDGSTWTTIGTFDNSLSGKQFYGSTVSTVDGRYVALGSLSDGSTTVAAVLTSTDAATWQVVELPSGTAATSNQVVAFNGQLVVYGTSSQVSDPTTEEATVAWKSTDGGKTFVSVALESDCAGSFSSVIVDQSAPEPTLFAVCNEISGDQEGDYFPSTDRLLVSRDGVKFEPGTNQPQEWSTPSDSISVGPLATDNGTVVLRAATPNGDGRRITLWRA